MGLPLVTSRGLPRWRPEAATWPWLWSITPTGAEFALTGAEFTALYTERLTRYGTARIARSLERIAREHDTDRIVLLCHESDVTRCHRGSLAAWWLTTTGEDIAEIK